MVARGDGLLSLAVSVATLEQRIEQMKISRTKAAKRMGISPSALRNAENRGDAPRHVKLHGIVLYEENDVDAYLAARTHGSAQ